MKKFLPLLLLLAAGCSTIPVLNPGSASLELVDAINGQTVTSMTHTPFLVDQEILSDSGDTALFWKELASMGFSLEEAGKEPLEIGAADFSLWGTGFDVEVFFRKYLPERAYLYEVKGPGGKFYLLFGSSPVGTTEFYGIKGPVL